MKNNSCLTIVALCFFCHLSTIAPTASARSLEARVIINDKCPVSNITTHDVEFAAIGVAVVAEVAGALVASAIDALANELTKNKVLSLTGADRLEGWYQKPDETRYKISPKVVCVIGVVSDEFENRKGAAVASPEVKQAFTAALEKAGGNEVDRTIMGAYIDGLVKLGINKPPLMYFEAVIATLKDGNDVFALQPTYIYYPEFIGKKAIFGKSSRDVLIQFEFSLPGETEAFASQKIQFEDVKLTALTSDRIKSIRLPWMKMPSTEGASAGSTGFVVPFNVKMLFTETSEPGTLSQIMGNVLSSKKDDIKTAVETRTKLAISATERQVARQAAADAANQALASYFTAYDEFKRAKQAEATAQTEDSAAKAKAATELAFAKVKFQNAEHLAASALKHAGVPFTRIKLD